MPKAIISDTSCFIVLTNIGELDLIQVVNAFNGQKDFHHIDSFGIVDRDKRQRGDVINLNAKGIWVLDVAEAENLLLLESVVKSVARHMGKDADAIFAQVKQNLINFFASQLESQILLYFKEILRRDFTSLTNFASRTIADVITEIDGFYNAMNKEALFNNVKAEFDNVVANNDYDSILRLFNLKNALIPNSKVCDLTGVKNKEEYLNLVITLLKKKDAMSQNIKAEIDSKITKNAT